MRRIVGGLLALLVALLLVPLAVVGAPSSRADVPLRILVYGDSITQGSTGDYTWRYFVDRHLREQQIAFDLVGPRAGLHHTPGEAEDDSGYAEPGFDTDHAAVWGQAFTTPDDDLGDLASAYTPDVVIALIGLNDLIWEGVAPEAIAGRWRTEIAEIRAASPEAKVVLVQVPETWYAPVPAYNEALVALATELDTPTARVVTSPLPDFDRLVDTWDNTHPTASGDLKIAVAVEAALFKAGVSPPAGMIPVVHNGPRLVSPVAAQPGIGQVSLTWRDVPGVTREWLERRDVTSGGGWYRYPLAFAAGTTSWSAAVVDGHRYEFRLRPAKGTAISGDVTSPVVSVVPGPRPPAPTLGPIAADAGGRLAASWSATADTTSYEIQLRDATRGEGWRTAGRTPAASWRIAGLVSGHRYEVRVRADNGLIEGATSAPAAASVPLLDPVGRAVARSPRRDKVRTKARAVGFATGYRLDVAPARSCRRSPRAGAFHAAGGDRLRPVATVRTRSAALWVRWYAVRDGVRGRLGARATACTRVR